MTFTEYNNQGDNPAYHPHVEIQESDICGFRKVYEGRLIALEILGEKFWYLLKKHSRNLYVPDPEGDSENDHRSTFWWMGYHFAKGESNE